jgi:hypothetical protein
MVQRLLRCVPPFCRQSCILAVVSFGFSFLPGRPFGMSRPVSSERRVRHLGKVRLISVLYPQIERSPHDGVGPDAGPILDCQTALLDCDILRACLDPSQVDAGLLPSLVFGLNSFSKDDTSIKYT